MDLMKTVVAVIIVLGFLTYGLPHTPAEWAFLNAPDPRSSADIPFLILRTTRNPVRFLNNPPGWDDINLLARRQWRIFLDGLATTSDAGRQVFVRLAQGICRDESSPDDRVVSVSLRIRPVRFGTFQDDVVWEAPEAVGEFQCP